MGSYRVHNIIEYNSIIWRERKIVGTVLVVYDTLSHSHVHEHTHTITHTHGGLKHTHTITHTHEHNHYIRNNKHGH